MSVSALLAAVPLGWLCSCTWLAEGCVDSAGVGGGGARGAIAFCASSTGLPPGKIWPKQLMMNGAAVDVKALQAASKRGSSDSSSRWVTLYWAMAAAAPLRVPCIHHGTCTYEIATGYSSVE